MDIMQLISGLRKMEEQALRISVEDGPDVKLGRVRCYSRPDGYLVLNFVIRIPRDDNPDDYWTRVVITSMKTDCDVVFWADRPGAFKNLKGAEEKEVVSTVEHGDNEIIAKCGRHEASFTKHSITLTVHPPMEQPCEDGEEDRA